MRCLLRQSLPCWLGLFLLFHASLFAQQKPVVAWGATAYYGFIYRHTAPIGSLTVGHPYGAEVYVNQLTTGTKPWHRLHRYPQIGLALGGTNFRSDRLGSIGYAIIYLDKSLLGHRSSGLRLKIGWGPGYAFNRYRYASNFQNVALSTRLNNALRGELYWSQRITPHWQVKSGLMLTHFSNGAFKMPNSGINIPAWQLGISYLPNPAKAVKLPGDTTRGYVAKKASLHLSAAFTLKENDLPGGRKFPGWVVSAYLNQPLNGKSTLNIGFDGTYNTAIRYQIARDTTLKGESKPDFKRAALTLGHELLISGHLAMLTQLGVYIYKPYKTESAVYQRYALKYYFGRRYFAVMALKAHFGTADFVEWTAGIKLR